MRRVLQIQNFDDLEKELNRLEKAEKVETSGIWSFYQILLHIGDFIHYSMKGYPFLLPKIFRKTAGKYLLKRILKKGVMDPGNYNPNTPKKKEEGNAIAALQRCKQVIQDFRKFQEELAEHPIFGKLDKETWERFHCIHASLHLSFAHPEFQSVEISPIEEVVILESKEFSDAKTVPVSTVKIAKKKAVSKKKKIPSKKKTTVSKKKKEIKKGGKKK